MLMQPHIRAGDSRPFERKIDLCQHEWLPPFPYADASPHYCRYVHYSRRSRMFKCFPDPFRSVATIAESYNDTAEM
jgi:hypothetical protein